MFTEDSGRAVVGLLIKNALAMEVLLHLNKRTMMVLYRSPEYKAVQVNNEDKYQTIKV